MFEEVRALVNHLRDVLTMLRRMVCVATVSQVDTELRRVKVVFDTGRIPESDWLSVIGSRTKGVNVSWNLAVGEQVLCLFPPIGSMVRGYVLGSLVNVNARPYTTHPQKFGVTFEDGTRLEYDQSTQTGTLAIKGAEPLIEVGPTKTRIVSDVEIEGAVSITDTLDVDKAARLGDTLEVTKATNLGDTLTVLSAINGMSSASFMGTVGAAGYGGPVSGGAAKMQNGAQMLGSATVNGIEISVDTHTHTDAEGRPTSAVN